MRRMSWGGLAAALCLGFTPGAGSALVISELFYDAVGADDGLSFVELYGVPGTSLDGVWLDDTWVNMEEEVYPWAPGFWWSFGSRPGTTAPSSRAHTPTA